MRIRHLVLAILIVAMTMLSSSAATSAEFASRSIGGQNLYGSSDDQVDQTGTGSRYSNGWTWRSGSSPTMAYMSVQGHGWNSEGSQGWHLVSYPFLSCTNCDAVGPIQTYRCGNLQGTNCSVPNYVTTRHYFEDSRVGTPTFYTSHNGLDSFYCAFYRFYASGC